MARKNAVYGQHKTRNSDGGGGMSAQGAPKSNQNTIAMKGVTNCERITESPKQCAMDNRTGPNNKPQGIYKHSCDPSDRPSSFRFK